MSFPVLHHEPARGTNIYAARFERVATLAEVQSALSAGANALFTSHLSARRDYTTVEVAAAIRHAFGAHHGIRGCAGRWPPLTASTRRRPPAGCAGPAPSSTASTPAYPANPQITFSVASHSCGRLFYSAAEGSPDRSCSQYPACRARHPDGPGRDPRATG
jgi:hypothetical protein